MAEIQEKMGVSLDIFEAHPQKILNFCQGQGSGCQSQVSGDHKFSARSRANTQSPTGFTPKPAAKACPSRAWKHLTRSGIPPAEKFAISGTGAGEATLRAARYAR